MQASDKDQLPRVLVSHSDVAEPLLRPQTHTEGTAISTTYSMWE
jgi:hypothetical protein